MLLKRGESPGPETTGPTPSSRLPTLTDEQRSEMATLGVTLRTGRYHFHEYVYDQVDDALDYAAHGKDT